MAQSQEMVPRGGCERGPQVHIPCPLPVRLDEDKTSGRLYFLVCRAGSLLQWDPALLFATL